MKQEEISLFLKRITYNPAIFNGAPVIREMRFKVADILDYLSSGMSIEEILAGFPYREKADMHASLYYAAKKNNNPILQINLDVA